VAVTVTVTLYFERRSVTYSSMFSSKQQQQESRDVAGKPWDAACFSLHL